MISYILESSICLVFLLLAYHLLLKRTKLFQFNRFYLLLSLLFSISIPMLDIEYSIDKLAPIANMTNSEVYSDMLIWDSSMQEIDASSREYGEASIQNIALGIYFLVSFLLIIRFFFHLFQLIRLSNKAHEVIKGHPTIWLEDQAGPFSFGRFLFISKQKKDEIFSRTTILDHEHAHRIQWHSLDILLVELIHCFYWFNPILIGYKKAIRMNHEFYADDFAIAKNGEVQYLNDLLEFVGNSNLNASKITTNPLTSGFSFQSIKNRIQMNKQSKPSMMKNSIRVISTLTVMLIILGLTAFKGQRIEHPIKIVDLSTKVVGSHTPSIYPISKVKLKKIASHYGMRMNPTTKTKKMHTGIDLVAPEGTPIIATANGTVEIATYAEGYGNHIIIKHDDTYQTMYAHLSQLNVEKGSKVEKGEIIGIIGNTGRSLSTHLHYEVIKDNEKVDPMNYLEE